MVTPRANKHHKSSRIRKFTIILRICWTLRFTKIYTAAHQIYGLFRAPRPIWICVVGVTLNEQSHRVRAIYGLAMVGLNRAAALVTYRERCMASDYKICDVGLGFAEMLRQR